MICNVILSKQDNNYIARAKDWPEIWAVEATRDQAILRIKNQLLEYLTQEREMISIEVPVPTHTGNPWLEKFGWFKEDPTFDDLQAEIAVYRQELDEVNQ
jgi:predicted RNase H-like HicB family nuclease